LLLFPDPRPLVDRLGREFFRELPEDPGVYLMRDAADAVLYVGKARNLRKRLGSYRVANPDRMPKRHLRLLRAVTRIDLEPCPDEPAALKREAELLRQLRPRFNRAGTWPAPPRCLLWQRKHEHLAFSVNDSTEPGWQCIGSIGAAARYVKPLVIRLLWRAIHSSSASSTMPAGWHRGLMANVTWIHCGSVADEANRAVEVLFSGGVTAFSQWVCGRQSIEIHPFDRAALVEDLENLQKVGTRLTGRQS
jgi:predicted GIY-YIG superfamily endonuclease